MSVKSEKDQHVTKASADDRAEVGRLAEAASNNMSLVYADQGYTGKRAAGAAQAHGMALEMVELPEVKQGFVLLPRH